MNRLSTSCGNTGNIIRYAVGEEFKKSSLQRFNEYACKEVTAGLGHVKTGLANVKNKLQHTSQYLGGKCRKLLPSSALIPPVVASATPYLARAFFLDKLLTKSSFLALYQSASYVDQYLNAAFRALGFGSQNILSGLPMMSHAFYAAPAETSRVLIGWLTDTMAGKILSCSVVGSLLSAGITACQEIRMLREGENRREIDRPFVAKASYYKVLTDRKLMTYSDLKNMLFSFFVSSLIAGPVVGAVSTLAATGARVSVRQISRLYSQHRSMKNEIQGLEKRLDREAQWLTSKSNELFSTKIKLTSIQDELNDTEDKLFSTRATLNYKGDKLKCETDKFALALEASKNTITELRSTNGELKSKILDLDSENKQMKNKVERLTKQVESKRDQLNSTTEELNSVENQLYDTTKKLFSAEAKLKKSNQAVDSGNDSKAIDSYRESQMDSDQSADEGLIDFFEQLDQYP